jgi:hypothetical protein
MLEAPNRRQHRTSKHEPTHLPRRAFNSPCVPTWSRFNRPRRHGSAAHFTSRTVYVNSLTFPLLGRACSMRSALLGCISGKRSGRGKHCGHGKRHNSHDFLPVLAPEWQVSVACGIRNCGMLDHVPLSGDGKSSRRSRDRTSLHMPTHSAIEWASPYIPISQGRGLYRAKSVHFAISGPRLICSILDP